MQTYHNKKSIIFFSTIFQGDSHLKRNRRDGASENDLSEKMNKQLSPARAVVRIIFSIIGLLIWFLIGVSPTIIFSSTIQQFMGVTSFFYKNPIYFLLVAFINIILGVVVYFLIGILWWAVFHLLWSIRWFYAYIKYRKVK